LEARPLSPSLFAAVSGDSDAACERKPDSRDHDERKWKEPDEEPVRERARHDPAADLAVSVHDGVDGIDRTVIRA
jgi:hypothetical protein